LADGFFAAASFAGFLPAIGMSISFCPVDALLDFLAGFFEAGDAAAAPPTLLRSASLPAVHRPLDRAASRAHIWMPDGGTCGSTVCSPRSSVAPEDASR
jgi:hypothetical protein